MDSPVGCCNSPPILKIKIQREKAFLYFCYLCGTTHYSNIGKRTTQNSAQRIDIFVV